MDSRALDEEEASAVDAASAAVAACEAAADGIANRK
jgi:hypothetical protein